MHDYPEISAAAPAVRTQAGIPKEVLAAITRALSAELQAGRSVRLKDLGTWTPYINSEGKRSVVFHPERSIIQRQTNAGATIPSNGIAGQSFASDADSGRSAPQPASFEPASRYAEPQNEGAMPIDVGSLFEEVKHEYRLYIPKDAPSGADSPQIRLMESERKTQNPLAAEKTATQSAPTPGSGIGTSIEPQPSADVQTPPAESEVSHHFQSADQYAGKMEQSNVLEIENDAKFQQHREQLFHPPVVRKPNTLNRLAFVLTMIVGCIIAYMMYTGGSFNSILPEDLQYRQTISIRHSAQVRGSGEETVRGIDS